MRKTCMTALVVGLAAAATAQEATRTPRIGVVDMGRISTESVLGKSYATQLDGLKSEIDAEGTKKQTELGKMDAAIKALQDDLEKQSSVLSPEAADRKKAEITKKSRERQAFLEDGQAELGRMRDRAQGQAQNLNNEFQQKMKPIIEQVAKEKGIDILLDSQVTLTVNKAFDISPEVIAKADEVAKTQPKASNEKPAAPSATGARPAAAKPPAKAATPAPAPSPTPHS